MPRVRTTIAGLLFHAGQMADRISRTTAYLTAGTRRLEEMQADHTRAWDSFYEKHSSHEVRLLPWEEECLGRFVTPGADVLLIGSGGGRDLLALIDRGCHVTGIDPSGQGLGVTERLLRARGLTASLIHGFFDDTPIPHTFDDVIFSYYCYATIPVASRRIAALKKAAALVRPGGHVIVSHAAGIPRPRAFLVRLGQLAGAVTRSDWRLEPGDLVSDNRAAVPSLSFTHAFEEGELEREAASANLRVVFHRVADNNTVVAALART